MVELEFAVSTATKWLLVQQLLPESSDVEHVETVEALDPLAGLRAQSTASLETNAARLDHDQSSATHPIDHHHH